MVYARYIIEWRTRKISQFCEKRRGKSQAEREDAVASRTAAQPRDKRSREFL